MGKWTVSLAAGVLALNGLLLAAHWIFPPPGGAPWIALEAGLFAGLAWLVPPGRRALRLAVALSAATVAVALSLLAFADAATWVIFARPVNLYLDLPLAFSARDLLAGMLGGPLALLAILLALLAVLAVTVVLATLLRWACPPPPRDAGVRFLPGRRDRRRWVEILGGPALVLPTLAALLLPRAPLSGSLTAVPRIGVPAVQLVLAQSVRLAETVREEEVFAELLASSPSGYGELPGLFERLGDRDVVLAFIESYGVSAIDDPRYAPVIAPRLESFGRRMEAAGLALASGTLVAPTQGGQSWFSHGSLLSGLWLDNQLRYDLMLGSGRETLIDDFRRAGYETVALVPAITFPWPEGGRLRYDRIFARADIPYAGPPLNWVTMPDQFSWHFLERKIRGGGGDGGSGRRPVFVEASLISSHAPWTPILPVLEDWESIGDGRVFDRWAGAGERPEELWLDQERVREHFALSVDYALAAMAAYAERYADEQLLLIVLGDHQPATLITGEGASWEVPVHVISGDAGLVEPFVAWGFERGAVPGRLHPERGMDRFRDWFVRAYSR